MTLPTPFLLASTFSDDVHLLLFVITRVNMFCGVVGGDTSPLAKNQAVLATILVPVLEQINKYISWNVIGDVIHVLVL